MKRTNIFLAALACVLLALSLASCGAFSGQSNYLQTITLNVELVNGAAPSGVTSLEGMGGTIQLQAIGNYTDKKTVDLTNKVTYTVVVDPNNNLDGDGGVLLPPCQPPSCPVPSGPPYTSGTLEYDNTGLLTAVEPAKCTWENTDPSGSSPAWVIVGDYAVTVTFEGVTSQPLYIPIASAGGVVSTSNPNGNCGPSSSGG